MGRKYQSPDDLPGDSNAVWRIFGPRVLRRRAQGADKQALPRALGRDRDEDKENFRHSQQEESSRESGSRQG